MIGVTVLGGGVAGLCAARALTDRGAHVHLIDRAAAPGPHACSWWAGGMLAPFCEGESAEEPVVRLGQEAAGWWHTHTGLVTRNGSLVLSLARDRADLRRFARRTDGHRAVTATEIAAFEPDLGERFPAGLFFESEAHLTPRLALIALRDGLERDGVTFEQREATPADLPGLVVDCRGYSARDDLPDLRGVKGEMLVLRCPEVTLHRPVRLLHPRIPLYIVPRGDGIFMLGATMIESSERGGVTARAMLELLSSAYALAPAFAEAEVIEIGVDIRPAYPDNMPRVARTNNLIRLNGLYRHGFLLAPAMARQVAEAVFDQQTEEALP
ncbi:FAD-dependent oxidoreductase [Puniceibacterium sp. IMCC21224]|uniref:FAD-dependent oxidoreductase n=1 Tax=Puniceibacterium sp. IMCC21224 TaxID=1618204 RepID=UPI00064E00FB|nr:FAD-dependent oxidoreductase [Puniceibacterium sp. IMCC21224]KMK66200.1 glycine oxidase [Puniceibacterium sp. IMCC21224]